MTWVSLMPSMARRLLHHVSSLFLPIDLATISNGWAVVKVHTSIVVALYMRQSFCPHQKVTCLACPCKHIKKLGAIR